MSEVHRKGRPTMTKTHTPGPWYVEDDNVFASTGLVAFAMPASSIETQDANLRLIASAPDLLAAVRCALERIEDGSMEQSNEHGQPTRHAKQVSADTIAHLRAAIQKAEGKE